MQFKNEITLEITKEDRNYRITMPSNAPLGEAYIVAGNFMDEIVRLINEHAEQVKNSAASEDTEENKGAES